MHNKNLVNTTEGAIKKESYENKLKSLEGIESIDILTEDETYTIETSEHFICGYSGTYMCDTLGNVCYDNLVTAGLELWEFLESENFGPILTINF